MADYNYINIAVHGRRDGELKTAYTYPSAPSDSDWTKYLVEDPEALIRNFLNARDCYVMTPTPAGRCFGLITRNPLEQRSGFMLLALMVAEGYALTGRQIVNTLSALKKTLLEDGDCNDAAVTRCLEAVGIPRQGVKLESWEVSPEAKASTSTCYRTYVSGQELEAILSFPSQPEYKRFDRVVVIPATASLKAGTPMDRITTPVKRIYTVVLPEGVTASKTVVAEGERLSLTFSKEGFNPRKETVVVGAPSPYVRYEGSAMRIKTPDESGMGFVRRVKILVKSAKGGVVTGYTINVNGRPVNTMEPYIELNELDMRPGSKTEISVASNNFRPLKVIKDSAALAANDMIELVLQPMEQGIILRLDFGEGRVFEQEISIEKSTPEYSQLHSGNFHGFRAHRLTTVDGGEIYNVDVRSSSKPTAPAFENVAPRSSSGPQRVSAPVFENVTVAKNQGDEPEKKSFTGIASWFSGKKLGYILGAAMAALLIVLAFVFILPGGSSDETETAAATDSAFTADPSALAETAPQAAPATPAIAAPEAAPAEVEKADVAYLNDNRNWDIEQVKSQKYKDLITAFQNGDIDAIANNDYFVIAGASTNRYANDIVTWLWQAKGTFQEGKNVKVLQDKVKEGKVNLYDLWEAVSRVKPSQPNPQPRPVK